MASPWETADGNPIVDADGKIIECDDCPCDDTCDADNPNALAALVEARNATATLTVESGDFADVGACCFQLLNTYTLPFLDRPVSSQVRFQDTFTLTICGVPNINVRVTVTAVFQKPFTALIALVGANMTSTNGLGNKVDCNWGGSATGDDCTELIFQDWSLPNWTESDVPAQCDTKPTGTNQPVTVRINL